MTACSPRRASGQLLVPALGWTLRDAQHRGGAARAATSPGVWVICSSREALPLPHAGLSHLAAPRGLQEPCWGAHAPGGGHSRGWVCGEGTELRTSGDKKLSGGKEAGRKEGEQSDHLLKSDWIEWGAPDAAASLPESVVELLRDRAGRPLKAAAGAGVRTERSLPPPPESPRSAARASSKHDPLAQSPAAPSERLLLLQRVGGLEAPLGITGARPRAEGAARLGRRRARGWSGGLGEGAAPLLRGWCAAPRRAASRPRPLPAASVVRCSVSEFAGGSAPRSRRGRAARRGLGSLQGSGSLPPRRGASPVPLGPGEGGVRGLGGHAGLEG